VTFLSGLLMSFLNASGQQTAAFTRALDLDRDGIADDLEQELLDRFVPRFLISSGECDTLPAVFSPGSKHPRTIARDGTIYGRVFPAPPGPDGAQRLEIHYYHLWSRDCGSAGHDLDAEHVSALAEMAGDSGWVALYWYAAAHEDTVCDKGTLSKASLLGVAHGGPRVWISRGKHASYLDPRHCSLGCGADVCSGPFRVLTPEHVINLGELASPLNGAIWVHSSRWPLARKFSTDFTQELLAGAATSSTPVRSAGAVRSAPQAVIFSGKTTIDALSVSQNRTGLALSAADSAVSHSGERSDEAVSEAFSSVTKAAGGALKRSGSSVKRFLRSTFGASSRGSGDSANRTSQR
jgi:hypothetical protein